MARSTKLRACHHFLMKGRYLKMAKEKENNTNNKAMTIVHLQQVLAVLAKQASGDFEIWLSSDEEGNEYLPMLKNQQFSLGVDKAQKRVIFYPSHR